MKGRLPWRPAAQALGALLAAAAVAAGCGTGLGGPAEPAGAAPVQVIGGLGSEPGKFFYPRSAAVNARGEVCVVDRSGRLQWFNPDGSFLRSVELPAWEKGQPTGINFARSGDLLVADSHYQRLLAYDAGDPGASPRVFRRWGKEGVGDGEFSLVRDVIEDSRGFIYAGDYNGPEDRIQKFTPEGKFLLAWGRRGTGAGEFQRPQGLAVERAAGGEERILVADSCNHRVQRFTTEGRPLGSFGRLGSGPGEMKYPYAVAASPPEAPGGAAVYVCEWGNNRIQRFDADGRPRGAWGQAGHAPGELATPWDVALGGDGRLYVVDFGNHRVQVFDPAARSFSPE